MTERDPTLNHFLAASLADRAPRPALWDQEPVRRKADALFAASAGFLGRRML